MKVGVRDIAQLAGVSVATVSNALNGRSGVSKAVSDRIFQVANELGYKRSKKNPERDYIRLVVVKRHGLVVGDTQFFAELIDGVSRGCNEEKVELIITQLRISDGADYLLQVRDICEDECLGVLLLATELEAEDLEAFLHCKPPLMVIDNLFRHQNVNSIVMNNYNAGYIATQALIGSGHRDIGFIGSSTEFSNMRYRRKGYEAAMLQAGLPISDHYLFKVEPTINGSYLDMARILKGAPELPTAFFAGNDIIALGSMRALSESGLRIPDDISLIGMDDTYICQAAVPPLTTVRVHRKEMGKAAVSLMLHSLPKVRQGVMKVEMSVELVARDSVAHPKN